MLICDKCGKQTKGIGHLIKIPYGIDNKKITHRRICTECKKKLDGLQAKVLQKYFTER